MKEYQIKVTSVDYCVTYEDINFDPFDNVFAGDDDMEAAERAADEEIAKIKAELPQELDLEITCEPEDLEDEIADAISDETGWLNNSFTYDIISEEDAGGHYNEDGYWVDDEDDEEEQQTVYFNVEIEVLESKNGKKRVFLANDGSSGCDYEFETKDELKQIVADYVADMLDYEYED